MEHSIIPDSNRNPNPNYRPPGIEGVKVIYKFGLNTEAQQVRFEFHMSDDLFYKIKRTVDYHKLINYCRLRNYNLTITEKMDNQTPTCMIISVNVLDFLEFETAQPYQRFVNSFLRLSGKTKYYTGKVICIGRKNEDELTIGKIYEIKNGTLLLDDGRAIYNIDSIDSPKFFGAAKFIEFVE